MSDKKMVKVAVAEFTEELKKNPSSRFSKQDFQMLVFGVLSDKDFKSKRYMLRGSELIESEVDINSGMMKFLDKLLKHAGVVEASERAKIIDGFEYNPKDIDWIIDAVDEAMYIYTECGKNMRMFRDKMLQLTIQKMVRTGKYDGRITYKKKIIDRALEMKKRSEEKQ
ncbi:MAG: hypothetical protein NC489_09145 [Ruminococcus flavefaciens]|nr:hypothetical protein [Ruminococcus flavefaciens]